jgi:hypothetical protein
MTNEFCRDQLWKKMGRRSLHNIWSSIWLVGPLPTGQVDQAEVERGQWRLFANCLFVARHHPVSGWPHRNGPNAGGFVGAVIPSDDAVGRHPTNQVVPAAFVPNASSLRVFNFEQTGAARMCCARGYRRIAISGSSAALTKQYLAWGRCFVSGPF